MKRCPVCLEVLPLSMFWRNRRQVDGFQSWCKPCMRAYRFSSREVEREHDRVRLNVRRPRIVS